MKRIATCILLMVFCLTLSVPSIAREKTQHAAFANAKQSNKKAEKKARKQLKKDRKSSLKATREYRKHHKSTF